MSTNGTHVLIVGAGIGGLCLAQGLKKNGVQVSVFERDDSPVARNQGFRIHLSPMGSRALAQCLPASLFELFTQTCGEMGQGFSLVDENLKELMSIVGPQPEHSAEVETHRSVSRITLRKVLLYNLGDSVQFGKKFKCYKETESGQIAVSFEDGTAVIGDVLVGADGVNSGVRKQYLPDANPEFTGVVAVGGTVPLDDEVISLMPKTILVGPVMIMPKEPCSVFTAIWKRQTEQKYIDELDKGLPKCDAEPDLNVPEGGEYLVMGFGAQEEVYEFGGKPEDKAREQLLSTLKRLTKTWHPNLRKLTGMIDVDTIATTRIRSSHPVAPWTPSRVTVLGDAIHSMTPYRGIGANVALRDAALLCDRLTSAIQAGTDLTYAIGLYEEEMREYAFKFVQSSLDMMHQSTDKRTFGFPMFKAAMRTINSIPALKMRVLQRSMGE